jgi:hypothetical protein
MAKIREGYRVISRSEGLAHIENFYRSGLRPKEYYGQQGLTECQFYGWRRRYLSLHPEAADKNHPVTEKPKKQFHPVKIETASTFRISGFEIHYPHGVRLVLGSDQVMEIDKLKELIKLRV